MLKMTNLKICYLTYQTFPAETANSQQTLSNIVYFVRNKIDIKLLFPLRDKTSSDSLIELKNYYNFQDDFDVEGLSHPYPFGKWKIFNKLAFHVSHYLWAKKATNHIITNGEKFDYFFTRSDWVFYFLSKKDFDVIFEVHQISKLRNLILRISSKKSKSKVILLNENLKDKLSDLVNLKNSIVLHNAADLDFFESSTVKAKEIVFVGNLKRFNNERNLKFIIEGYAKSELTNNYKFTIIGGPSKDAETLLSFVKKRYPNLNIDITGRLPRLEAIRKIRNSEIGIMINDSNNVHSTHYTSPLKYFEYLAAGLIVLAVDFPAHRTLPHSENIIFFKENQIESLKEAFNESANAKFHKISLKDVSLDTRVKKIINFLNI
jgi:hypothetical protein